MHGGYPELLDEALQVGGVISDGAVGDVALARVRGRVSPAVCDRRVALGEGLDLGAPGPVVGRDPVREYDGLAIPSALVVERDAVDLDARHFVKTLCPQRIRGSGRLQREKSVVWPSGAAPRIF